MPLGATPSRWCVCQFHHFRTSKLPCFQLLNQCILEGPINCIGCCTDPLCLDSASWLHRDSRPPSGQAILNRVHRILNVAHRCLYIVSCPATYCNLKGFMYFWHHC